MKKILLFFILILSALFPASCSCKEDSPTISLSQTEFVVALNDTIDLQQFVKIEGSDNGLECVVANKQIVSVVDGVVTPISAGETTIKCRVAGYGDVYDIAKIVVRGVRLAETASVPLDEVVINLGVSRNAYNRVEPNENVTEIPTIYCNSAIATYNYATGEVSAVSVGETTIRVVFERCVVEFDVIVENSVFVEQLDLKRATMYVGDRGVFDFTVIPSNANQLKFYTSSDIIEVGTNGGYMAKKSGEAIVNCDYYMVGSENVKRTKSFTVSINDLPDYLDFSVVGTENQNITYMFIGDTAKILFDLKEYESLSNFEYSSNIEVVSSDLLTDSNGKKYVLFEAKEAGEIKITVTCRVRIGDFGRVLSKEKIIRVYTLEQITMVAKYDLYDIGSDADGNYYIQSGSIVSYLKFTFNLVENVLNDVEIYRLSPSGDKIKLENNVFKIEGVGEYILVAEYYGNELKRFSVVVG